MIKSLSQNCNHQVGSHVQEVVDASKNVGLVVHVLLLKFLRNKVHVEWNQSPLSRDGVIVLANLLALERDPPLESPQVCLSHVYLL